MIFYEIKHKICIYSIGDLGEYIYVNNYLSRAQSIISKKDIQMSFLKSLFVRKKACVINSIGFKELLNKVVYVNLIHKIKYFDRSDIEHANIRKGEDI